MKKQLSLFDENSLETNPNYVSPKEKNKWNQEFKKFILKKYNEAVKNNSYMYQCNSLKFCNQCEMKYCNGSSDCLVSLKKYCKENNIEINYKDYDFENLVNKIEENN